MEENLLSALREVRSKIYDVGEAPILLLSLLEKAEGEIIMRKMVDLYAGFGGASEPFLRAGWDVLRVDNNELLKDVPNMMIADLVDEEFFFNAHWFQPDLLWASPPCTDFSLAFNAPGPTAKREGREFKPDLKPLMRAIDYIKLLQPKNAVIENVHGASKIFSEILGVERPTQIIGPYFLWGNFPWINMPRDWKPDKKTEVWKIDDPLRANHRAIVDFQIGENLRKAIESQMTLRDYI